MERGWLLPDLDDVDGAPFWEGTARKELLVQQCAACGQRRMPPRPMCPKCRSIESQWAPVSGKAKIWSFIVPHPPLLPAFQELAPYAVITVELDEEPGLRMVGNLVTSEDGAINEIDPATIEIGEAVEVVFSKVEDVHIPRWVRVG
jgi:uncharacterized OB-fold protein